jgi:hypothetical protein
MKSDTEYPYVEVHIKGTNQVLRFYRIKTDEGLGIYEATKEGLMETLFEHFGWGAPQTKPEGYGKAVPLSDEEIEEIMKQFYSYNPRLMSFARAIEAKVRGEK